MLSLIVRAKKMGGTGLSWDSLPALPRAGCGRIRKGKRLDLRPRQVFGTRYQTPLTQCNCKGYANVPMRCPSFLRISRKSFVDGGLESEENGFADSTVGAESFACPRLFGFTTLRCGVLPKMRDSRKDGVASRWRLLATNNHERTKPQKNGPHGNLCFDRLGLSFFVVS
jgi:hypothetical protein